VFRRASPRKADFAALGEMAIQSLDMHVKTASGKHADGQGKQPNNKQPNKKGG